MNTLDICPGMVLSFCCQQFYLAEVSVAWYSVVADRSTKIYLVLVLVTTVSHCTGSRRIVDAVTTYAWPIRRCTRRGFATIFFL